MTAGVVIRPLHAADVDAAAAVHLPSFLAGNGSSLPAHACAAMTLDALRERLARLAAAPAPGACHLLAERAGEVEGLASAGPPREPGTADATGELYALYIDPAAWGRGTGGALHDAALDHLAASGCRRAQLWVMEGNDHARAFYAARGWAPDGSRRAWEGAAVVGYVREL